jgi:tRNA nucleotidyltransferase (CCA-adding enzyme)
VADDLARRDFTINALAAPLGTGGPEGLIDPFRGMEDLRARRVRVLHERSFVDDPTRAYRAVRGAAELGFEIHRPTSRLIREAVARGLLERLSAARLRHEVERTLEASRPGRAVRLLDRLGLLGTVAAGLRAPRGIESVLDRATRVVSQFKTGHSGDPLSTWAVVLALLLRPAGSAIVEATLERLQPSRGVRLAVHDAIDAVRRIPRELSRTRSRRPSVIHRACHGRSTEALLAVLATTSSASTRRSVRVYLDLLRDARADITGRDLVKAGIRPGPAVARGLEAALVAKLDGKARGRREQLRAALSAASRS